MPDPYGGGIWPMFLTLGPIRAGPARILDDCARIRAGCARIRFALLSATVPHIRICFLQVPEGMMYEV